LVKPGDPPAPFKILHKARIYEIFQRRSFRGGNSLYQRIEGRLHTVQRRMWRARQISKRIDPISFFQHGGVSGFGVLLYYFERTGFIGFKTMDSLGK
jgi:hypothetical protein